MCVNGQFFSRYRLACVGIMLASVLAFAGAIKGLPVWDDHTLLTANGGPLKHVFTRPFLGGYFRPAIGLSFYIDRFIWGGNPFGYHQTNLLIHALTTGLLISLVRFASGDGRAALLAGMLFAIHPVHASSAGWIGGRTDSLACLFSVAYALFLFHLVRSESQRRRLLLTGTVAVYLMAMACKEQLVLLVVLAPLTNRLFGERPLTGRHFSVFAATAGAYVAGWFLIAPPRPVGHEFSSLPILERVGISSYHYMSLLAIPTWRSLHTFTFNPVHASGILIPLAGLVLSLIGVAITGLALRRKSPIGWWGAWLVIVLAPACNFVPMTTLWIAPYRAELATASFIALFAITAVAAWDRVQRRTLRFAAAFVMAGMTLSWLWISVRATQSWTRDETLFGTLAEIDSTFVLAHYELAGTLLDRGDAKSAAAVTQSILERLIPGATARESSEILREMSDDGRLARQISQNQGGRISPRRWFSILYAELGEAKLKLRRIEEAEHAFSVSLTLDPRCAQAAIGLDRCRTIKSPIAIAAPR